MSSRRQFVKTAFAAAASVLLARAGTPATVLRYPYLQNVRRNRVTIRWTTLERGNAAVEYTRDGLSYSTAPAISREFRSPETGSSYTYYRHEAVIGNLPSGTDFDYRVTMDGEDLLSSENLRFRTAGAQAFQVLAVGDSGCGSPEQLQLARRMQRETPRLLIHTGDLAYPSSTFEQLDRYYFDYYRGMMKQIPFFPCPGNHDYYDTEAIPYLTVHDLPHEDVQDRDQGRYFSFDWNNVHFISLDTNEPLLRAVNGEGDMLAWLRKDLQKSRRFWTVPFFHHPPYAFGPNAGDILSKLAREFIVPILEEHDVRLVLSGHEHSYQRSHAIHAGTVVQDNGGTVYLTSGGGGAPLYPVHPSDMLAAAASKHHYLRLTVDGYRMIVDAVDANGDQFDSVTVAPQPRLSAEPVVNSASFTPAIAAGGLVSIFGRWLAAEDLSATGFPAPYSLAGLSVAVNDEPCPLLMVSAQQVNAQLPFGIAGPARLRLSTPNGVVEREIFIAEMAPALFHNSAFHEGGLQISEETPATRGEIVTVYAIGLGSVDYEINGGESDIYGAPTAVPVRVLLGDSTLDALYSGYAPGLPGVYKVRFRIPSGIRTGQLPLSLLIGEHSSNTITVAVA